MKCPNCGSSRVRRAKRNIAEKVFLSLLVTRPFRCEDCIARFFSFLWRSAPNFSAADADAKSLVYRSATAALHSEVYRSRKARRKSPGKAQAAPALAMGSVTSWLKKPIQQPKQPLQPEPTIIKTLKPREMPDPEREFFPQILGVILEMKHEHS